MKTKRAIVFLFLLAAMFPEISLAQWNVGSLSGFGLPGSSILGILTAVMNWILAVLGIVGIIGFAISGILYLTSAGDGSRMETAKKAMVYSIIGIIVGLSGLVVIRAVVGMLNARNKF